MSGFRELLGMGMVDVFISYPRNDKPEVEAAIVRIRDRLKALRISLFFDIDDVDTGASFPKLIEENIYQANVVLGCWTSYALTREWILIEADIAKRNNKLFAVALEPIDRLPALFHFVNVVELFGFYKVDRHPGWTKLLNDLGRRLGRPGLDKYELAVSRNSADALEEWAHEFPLDPLAENALHISGELRRASTIDAVRKRQTQTHRREEREERKAEFQIPSPIDPANASSTPAELALRRALESGGLDDLQSVQEMFPGTVEAFEARRLRLRMEREAQIWRDVDKTAPAALSEFIHRWPNHPRYKEAVELWESVKSRQIRLEQQEAERMWEIVNKSNAAALRTLLEQCKFAPIVEKVRNRLSELSTPGYTFRSEPNLPEMIVMPQRSIESLSREEGVSDTVAISKYPITKREWSVFALDVAADDTSWLSPGFMQEDHHPVVNVSWYDAKAYLEWLCRRTDMPYRLLSETEWEFTCRAGADSRYSFGDKISTQDANFGGSFRNGPRRSGLFKRATTAVDFYPPNAFGLHDMHGNAWEWVDAEIPGSSFDFKEHRCSILNRVAKGGSWGSSAEELQISSRLVLYGAVRFWATSFRIAVSR